MTDYQLIKQLVNEMKIGEVRTIPMPKNIKMFRSHLTSMSSGGIGRFTTKSDDDKLHIARIKKESVWDKLT